MSGQQNSHGKQDVFGRFVQGLAVLATLAAVALGPLSGMRPTWAGVSLLVLAAAHWFAWFRTRAPWCVHAGAGLFALGSVLVIFGEFADADVRLGAGAGVVLALFAFSVAMRDRFPDASGSTLRTGHLTSIVLACAALAQIWPQDTWSMWGMPILGGALALWTMPTVTGVFVLIYALMPGLRKNFGFRLGAALWVCLVVLFCLSARAETVYWKQMPLAVYLSLVAVAAGYGLRRAGSLQAWSTALYACGAIFAGYCGLVNLFTPAAEGTWQLFLVSGIVFACLFLILRQDVFVYLVTLSLSLMAYSWVKVSTSFFTQDVLFYLILFTAILGAFFSLPHLKKLIVRSKAAPMISIFTWHGRLLVGIVIVGVALLLLSAYALKLTSHPMFCSSCHNMDEFYATWQHSSHKNVACTDCHFDPGPTALVEGKIAGLVQVVKYVSHSYAPKPHAMISNESCMRPGCHAEMDHEKETYLFHGRIKFRHDKHLNGSPRGKTLNCVSCHGYTGMGEHISITKTTCLTCHFYDRKSKPVATGQCTTCHSLPDKPVTFMGQEFKHRKFLAGKENVRCEHCHNQVTQGAGAISPTRCRSCHSNKPREIGDHDEFHITHVSKGHFDCLQCHDEIKHGTHPMAQDLLAKGNCKSCHSGERHTVQERIYAGTAIPEMKPMPDPMYKAGVACGGCHTDVRKAGLGAMPFTKKFSGPKQCADCHSRKIKPGVTPDKTKYGKMLVGWQGDTKDRLAEYQAELDKLDKALASAKATQAELAEVWKWLAAARTRLSYIIKDGSFGAHNYPYVSQILDDVEEDIDKYRPRVAKWKKAAGGSP